MSESKKSRIFRCMVCETAEIAESHAVVPPSGIDDRYLTGGCDYNSYKDHEVTGGVLFDDRPDIPWRDLVHEEIVRNFFGRYAKEESLPVGGICDDCLKNAAVKALLPRIRGLKIK